MNGAVDVGAPEKDESHQLYLLNDRTVSLIPDCLPQVSRFGTQRSTWLPTSSSREASSQSWESSSPLSSRLPSLAASLPSRVTRHLLLVHVHHCTLTSHSQRHSFHHRTHTHTHTESWLSFILLLINAQLLLHVSGAHRRRNVLQSLTHSYTHTQIHCRESSRHTRAVSPLFFFFYVRSPFHISPSFLSRLSFMLFCHLRIFMASLTTTALSWTLIPKFYLANCY